MAVCVCGGNHLDILDYLLLISAAVKRPPLRPKGRIELALRPELAHRPALGVVPDFLIPEDFE